MRKLFKWSVLVLCICFFFQITFYLGENTDERKVEKQTEEVEVGTIIEFEDSAEQYYGKWKVIQYIPLNKVCVERTYFHKEHYLGRTVEITSDTYTKSIHYWPQELEKYTVNYDYCKIRDISKDDMWITQNAQKLRWLEGEYFDDTTIRMLVFYKDGEEYPESYCAVTKDNAHIIETWLDGKFLLERFCEQEQDFVSEDIHGEWEITRIDSYDNVYEGHIKDAEYVPVIWTESLELSDFYAPDWFGEKICITNEAIKSNTAINGKILEIKSQIVDKDTFEEEQGIHDGISLTNDELLVYDIYYGDSDDVLTIVPVHENKIIIHIDMGWFVAEK